ncbi:MAG: hypothetical protein LCI00_14845 [Chloroflexi bacterium]|nr:hypothetical protein [Chloroflexota bacterium]MCC6892574.1 hypothetical protein [Anaerolineae bacterium]
MILGRYLRAFWGALRLTLRGETYRPPIPQSPIAGWVAGYAERIKAVIQAADQNGLDSAARKQIKLRLDGRQMSLETTLLTLQFHANEEYASLLRQGTSQRVLNTVYATNINDHYWVITVAALPDMQKPSLQAPLQALEAHLGAIPKVELPNA